MKSSHLHSFEVQNFKAIRDSGNVEFGWLTAFIGNNGVGKSSLVEALETCRDVVVSGVDAAFGRWRGFEHALNKAVDRKLLRKVESRISYTEPMRFVVQWNRPNISLKFSQSIALGPGGNSLFIQDEEVSRSSKKSIRHWTRNDKGQVSFEGERDTERPAFEFATSGDGQSILEQTAWIPFDDWQFLMLNPERMGQPTPQQRAVGDVRLTRDGGNIAQYLDEIRKKDSDAFQGFLEAIRFVLPYAADLQPSLTSELERAFYLNLKEEEFEVPGWLLSTGTLRIAALLACLHHPDPPPLLVVEEIENGLDPHTLHMLVAEIRAAIDAKRTQVILTTHSPYLLDLLDLSHIVVVEREDGQPVFRRPDAKA